MEGLQDPDRRGDDMHSAPRATNQSQEKDGHQLPSVKRHDPRRFSNSVGPYPRPSLLSAIRRKASTTLQEALKWPQAQLSKLTTVKKIEKAAKEEEARTSESTVVQSHALISFPIPSKHVAQLGAAEATTNTEIPPGSRSSPISPSHYMTFADVESKVAPKATPVQSSLLCSSAAPQENNIVGGDGEKIRLSSESAGMYMIPHPCRTLSSLAEQSVVSSADDLLSEGEIDETSIQARKTPRDEWTSSDQIYRDILEATVRNFTPVIGEHQCHPPRGPRQTQPSLQNVPRGPRQQRPSYQKAPRKPRQGYSSHQQPSQGPGYQPLTIRTESVYPPPCHPYDPICYQILMGY
ncbi:hypothetical protein H2200_008017 [Cladophialophora chaetospira]|uniref:Uncharacterized protein n=1 Tax=Cladophialophora chaetospira TaxID=386627 RepID=A0AA38X6Z7_9EURO|nr:hypothetical protein H2200_008017 [Cladophialophora chaetospira]